MLLRLIVGLLKGLLIGGLAGFGVATLGYATPSALVAYPAVIVVGLIVATLAGKPIWAEGARIEVGMKAVVAAIFAPLLLWAARSWLAVPLPIDPAVIGVAGAAGAPLGTFAVTSFAMVAGLLAGFFDADNDPRGEEPAAERKGAAKKRIEVAGGTDAEATVEAEQADEANRRRRRK